MNTQKGFLALLVSGIIYSTFGIFIRVAGESFGTLTQVFIRCVVTVLIASILIIIFRKKPVLPKEYPAVMGLFLLSPSLSIASLTFAISMIKAANGIFFLYSGYILTTVICGALFYRERLTKNKILALIIALIGIFLFSYPFEFTSSLGMVFAMTAGVLDALNSTICKRLGSGDSIVLIFYRYLAGFVLAGIFLIFIREPISSVPPIVSIFSIIILGVSMFAIDSLWLYGFSHFDLNIGSIVTSVELVIAPVINALFIHEYPTKFELTGGLCIIMSIVLINTLVINQKRILKKRKEIYAN